MNYLKQKCQNCDGRGYTFTKDNEYFEDGRLWSDPVYDTPCRICDTIGLIEIPYLKIYESKENVFKCQTIYPANFDECVDRATKSGFIIMEFNGQLFDLGKNRVDVRHPILDITT